MTDNFVQTIPVAVKTEGPKSSSGQQPIHVKISAPYKIYFDGEARSISAVNDTGPFDVLARHHKFITLLNPCDIVVRTDEGEQKFRISRGLMHVKADQVIVFLDI